MMPTISFRAVRQAGVELPRLVLHGVVVDRHLDLVGPARGEQLRDLHRRAPVARRPDVVVADGEDDLEVVVVLRQQAGDGGGHDLLGLLAAGHDQREAEHRVVHAPARARPVAVPAPVAPAALLGRPDRARAARGAGPGEARGLEGRRGLPGVHLPPQRGAGDHGEQEGHDHQEGADHGASVWEGWVITVLFFLGVVARAGSVRGVPVPARGRAVGSGPGRDDGAPRRTPRTGAGRGLDGGLPVPRCPGGSRGRAPCPIWSLRRERRRH